MSVLPLLLLALLTRRWWTALGRALLDDVSAAGEAPGGRPARDGAGALASIRVRPGRPVRRGFHRLPRGSVRTRWEGGFGRRGL